MTGDKKTIRQRRRRERDTFFGVFLGGFCILYSEMQRLFSVGHFALNPVLVAVYISLYSVFGKGLLNSSLYQVPMSDLCTVILSSILRVRLKLQVIIFQMQW